MKIKLFCLILLVISNTLFANPSVEFLSPKPNSKYNKVAATIILRFNYKPYANGIDNHNIEISGSKSGIHKSRAILSDDEFTMIFAAVDKFRFDETVSVNIKSINTEGGHSELITYSFETEKEDSAISIQGNLSPIGFEQSSFNNDVPNQFTSWLNRAENLPADFPPITITNSVNPSPGYIFLSNFGFGPIPWRPYLMILDNYGNPVYYKKLDTMAADFKKQPNGNLTYYYTKTHKFYEMNPFYQVIDSFDCGNGYYADVHELRLLENGHALLMSYDEQNINMSQIVPSGSTNARVIGLVIQELDRNKNTIFQWRSWDYFSITDATHENLSRPLIDYAHGNAIELTLDGNILISSRHMDEITKVNRKTGEIIWRLGGKHNQFKFIGDTVDFSHQHAVRQLPNGNITLFDNGNYHASRLPGRDSMFSFSRAVEYNLDETEHTATLVWQYINTPVTYGDAMGYVERLPNGNTTISWGSANPTFTEVNPQGEKVFELSLPQGVFSYRAIKDDWSPGPFETETPTHYTLYQNYPNPFNPGTNIRYAVPEQGDVKISVYNILGQTVQQEVRNNLAAGTYNYFFNGANLSNGVYFYRIEANSFSDTKKMVLVK